ncbi:sugar phosphate isomerase/epimerase family protein [Paenibacillus cremeus]|uniref:Sugar phosphate isomerase/epimerase n=1 Tax=Paenibacillus cremeus TaxID=2163881 RepID=A0A559KE15_9BACL|nr:TIM barrel protein [Paenibacillus cremeus]TVY10354.1 sugar phosphate isomerase/epimerase [Paenibacillus cremeus]
MRKQRWRIFFFFIPEGDEPERYEEEVLRRMRELVRLAEEANVTLIHENEKEIYGDTGVRYQKLLIALSSAHLRSAFDPANFVQCKVKLMSDAYPLVEPYIAYTNVNDALMETGKVVPIGEGDGQLEELIGVLKDKNYSGFLSLEPHLRTDGKYQGFSGPELFKVASQSLKQLLAEAGVEWR